MSQIILTPLDVLYIVGLNTALVVALIYLLVKHYRSEHQKDLMVIREEYLMLHSEQELAERLLLNILPKQIIDRLLKHPKTIYEHHQNVTILFADLVNFTRISSKSSSKEIVELLNEVFSLFDRLTDKFRLEKIKTIGDAYMVVGGLPGTNLNHGVACAQMALEMRDAVAIFNQAYKHDVQIRIGINSGPVIAGVIGTKKFIYDVWGDAVNVASRMESHGLPGETQITENTLKQLDDKFEIKERGKISIKGKGKLKTYLLIRRR